MNIATADKLVKISPTFARFLLQKHERKFSLYALSKVLIIRKTKLVLSVTFEGEEGNL